MKILFTGGGSGGHFYPVIAIAQEINKLAEEKRLVDVKLFYMSDRPYNQRALFENQINFSGIIAGKRRAYFSILNYLDIFKTIFGVIIALFKVFRIFPDVVFGKGGYASFPGLVASRVLGIPVIIHESDVVPGRVNLWAGKFARRVALGYPEAAQYFPADKTAVVGNPVRREVMRPVSDEARKFFGLNENLPVILVLGGSLGAAKINEVVVDLLPKLLEKYQVIHQTGKNNFDEVSKRISVILNETTKTRYRAIPYLEEAGLAMAAGLASLIISRAGAGAIAEVSQWGIPSIIVPIAESPGGHQRQNALSYTKSGAAVLLEEGNLKDTILFSEIERIMNDQELSREMSEAARAFSRPDAARLIALEILRLALKHEK